MVRVIAFAIEAAGCPIAVGGAKTLLAAFERLIVDHGGAVRSSADVVRILPGTGARASGVELAGGSHNNGREGRDLLDPGRNSSTMDCSRTGPRPPPLKREPA